METETQKPQDQENYAVTEVSPCRLLKGVLQEPIQPNQGKPETSYPCHNDLASQFESELYLRLPSLVSCPFWKAQQIASLLFSDPLVIQIL